MVGTTRTRPDLSVGVAAVCRLATKNPVKAIEIGMTLMEYLKGNPGSLRYTADIPTEPFGKKGQLKVARSTKTLEVFADIAYSAGSRHRSVQGLAIYFAGCPIAWQTSLQPFVTHSTAESELVSLLRWTQCRSLSRSHDLLHAGYTAWDG